MAKKLNNEIIDARLKEENRPIKRLDNYVNMRTSIKWMCLNEGCGRIWKTTPDRVIGEQRGCASCIGKINATKRSGKLRTKTNEDIDNFLLKNNVLIKRLGNCNKPNSKIEWLCLDEKCYNIWQTKPSNIFGGSGCPACGIKQAHKKSMKTNEEVDIQLLDRNHPVKRLGNYQGAFIKIEWQCLNEDCNHIWMTTPHTVDRGKGCPRCGILKNIKGHALTNEIVDKRLLECKQPIKRLGDYKKAIEILEWQCLNKGCGYIWETSTHAILNHDSGCPKCNVPGSNEKLMHSILEKSFKNYIIQYRIQKIDTNVPNYKLDAFIPDLKIAIEYNGLQHYEAKSFWVIQNAEEQLIKQQKRDQFVRDFCNVHGIFLIEIDGRKFYDKKLVKYLLEKLIPFITNKYSLLKESDK